MESFKEKRLKLLQNITSCDEHVVMITASMGYGKSHLIAEVKRHSPNPVLLELNQSHADNSMFARSVVRAFQKALPEVEIEALEDDATALEKLLAIAEAANTVKNGVQFLFDGSHVLASDTTKALTIFMSTLDTSNRVYIAGYDSQNLRLGSFSSKGQLATVTQDALSLDLNDVKELLASNGIDPQDAWEASQGMFAAIRMFAAGASLDSSDPELWIADLYENLEPDLQVALYSLAVLDVWSEDNIKALKIKLPQGWLQKVRGTGLPMSSVNDPLPKPHNFLAEFLENRLRLAPLRYKVLSLRAAYLAVANDQKFIAVQRFLAVGDVAKAKRFAQQGIGLNEQQGQFASALAYINLFKVSDFSPAMIAIKTLCLVELGELQQAKALLQPHQDFEGYSGDAFEIFAISFANLNYGLEQYETQVNQQLVLLPRFENSNRVTNYKIRLAQGYHALQRYDDEVALLYELKSELEYDDPIWLETMANCQLAQGNSLEAEKLCFAQMTVAKSLASVRKELSALNLLAIFAAMRNKYQEARETVDHLLELAQRYNPSNVPAYRLTSADIFTLFGDVEAAQRECRLAAEFNRGLGLVSQIVYLSVLEGQLRCGEITENAFAAQVEALNFQRPDEVSSLAFVKLQLDFKAQNDARVLELAELALQNHWIIVQCRTLGFALAAAYRSQHHDFQRYHSLLLERLAAFNNLRVLFPDWTLLAATFTELQNNGYLHGLQLPDDMETVSSKPHLKITSFGKTTIQANQDVIHLHPSQLEVLVFLGMNKSATIDEILEVLLKKEVSRSARDGVYKKIQLARNHLAMAFGLSESEKDRLLKPNFNSQYSVGDAIDFDLDADAFGTVNTDLLLKLYQGEFLESSYLDWSIEQRREFEEEFIQRALEHAADLDRQSAIPIYERVIACEAYCYESAARGWLVRAHLRLGDVQAAIRAWNSWDDHAKRHDLERPDRAMLSTIP